MKYFLYTRRSTDEEKQALSTESQQEHLRQTFGHLDIIELPPESASAFKPHNRPIFADMMQRLEKGEATGIIAWHPDRLSRNPLDAAQLMWALDRGIIQDLKFGSFHFDNSPEGKMMLGFALSQSKYYSEKLAKDVLRGMTKKCEMGHIPCRARLGYRNSKIEERGRRRIEPDPERFEIVRKAWDLLLTGAYTVPDIWRKVTEEWNLTLPATRRLPERPLSLTTMYDIFTSLMYTGHFEWNGKRYKGNYPAMITLDEYERAQRILGKKGKYQVRKNIFSYTGFMRCGECGSMITAEWKQKQLKSGEVSDYIYYSCVGKKGPCSQRKCMREEKLEDVLRPYVESLAVSPRVNEWVKKHIRRLTMEDQQLQKRNREDVQRRYEKSMQAIQNLVALYISVENGDKSLLSEEEFKKQKELLIAERDRWKQSMEENERSSDTSIERTIQLFDFATNALHWLNEGDTNTKRLIFVTIGQNWTLLDQIAHNEAKPVFSKVREGVAAHRQLTCRSEPKENGYTEPLPELTEAEISLWWPRPDSNW